MMVRRDLRGRVAALAMAGALVVMPAPLAAADDPGTASEPRCTKLGGVRIKLLNPARATRGGAVLRMVNAARCPAGSFKVRWPGGSKVVRLGPDSKGAARTKLPRLEPGDQVSVEWRHYGRVGGRDSITIKSRPS